MDFERISPSPKADLLKNMKNGVLIAITHTGDTVAGLEAKLSKWIYESEYNAELYFSNINPTYSNRNTCVKYFLEKTKYSHLLFIDSDTVPFDNPLKMVKHNVDVVGGVYPMWRIDHFEWLAMEKQPNGLYKTVPADKRKGLVEVDGLGAGCLLIKRKVLENLEAPFKDKIGKDGRREIGHDYYFCERVKKKGYKIYADWDILCDHIKQVPLITIVKAIKRAYDEGYKNGLTNDSD